MLWRAKLNQSISGGGLTYVFKTQTERPSQMQTCREQGLAGVNIGGLTSGGSLQDSPG